MLIVRVLRCGGADWCGLVLVLGRVESWVRALGFPPFSLSPDPPDLLDARHKKKKKKKKEMPPRAPWLKILDIRLAVVVVRSKKAKGKRGARAEEACRQMCRRRFPHGSPGNPVVFGNGDGDFSIRHTPQQASLFT